jgi:polar amino acid transport system substrate-binding protein
VLAAIALTAPARADNLRLVADEWFPYNGRPGATPEGYMVDLARRIAGSAGIKVEYRTLDWLRALDEVRAGRADCVLGATRTDAPDFVFPNEPWGHSNVAFFVADGTRWQYRDAADLKRIRLGAIEGYNYGEAINDYVAHAGPGRAVVISGSRRGLAAAFAQLLAHKIDATVDDLNVGLALIQTMNLRGRVRVAGLSGEGHDAYIACSPASPRSQEYAELFDRGLRKLRDSGGLARMLEPYGLKDWIIAP